MSRVTPTLPISFAPPPYAMRPSSLCSVAKKIMHPLSSKGQ
ncbi:hypothetical protein MUK42_05783 [Musa troglodytarum]|uniref:Uncharacterized protein n=1 Tax=Musa troglodytarum TaxID=320322 RepID=A0A9E7EVB4_9LILI|nr:hypothetical protein MUK42_05948 [Musa troglodytarum]URD82488.1 hypothetical protein MUK42_05783 [Musa troglodytarum]